MNNRVLLIESLGESDFKPGLFTRGNSLEPYALGCLASSAEAKGYSVAILQPRGMSVEQIVSHAVSKRPFCIGLSVWTHTSAHAIQLADALKMALPQVPIIVGGQHPSLVPDYIRHPSLDYAVIGEGEITFVELLDCLSGKSQSVAAAIHGIAYKSPDKQSIILAQPRTRIVDLDELPLPKRDAAYLRRARSWNFTYPSPANQTGVAQITYSRGCRFRCTFCVSPTIWSGTHGKLSPSKSVTYRSPASVAREVKKLHQEHGVNFLYFTDLTFNDDPKRVQDLCKAFIDEGLHNGDEYAPDHLHKSVHWFALLKVGLDHETAQLMAKAGCSKIGMGVESFDTSQVHSYKKPYKGVGILRDSLTAADDAGIINRCLLIIGAPEETHASVDRTIEGLLDFPIDQIRVAFLTPYPNTPVHAQYSQRLAITDYQYFDEEHPVIQGDHISVGDLYAERLRIAWEFYGSATYKDRCRRKLDRFPWLTSAYEWFLRDLFEKSSGEIDLRDLTSNRTSHLSIP